MHGLQVNAVADGARQIGAAAQGPAGVVHELTQQANARLMAAPTLDDSAVHGPLQLTLSWPVAAAVAAVVGLIGKAVLHLQRTRPTNEARNKKAMDYLADPAKARRTFGFSMQALHALFAQPGLQARYVHDSFGASLGPRPAEALLRGAVVRYQCSDPDTRRKLVLALINEATGKEYSEPVCFPDADAALLADKEGLYYQGVRAQGAGRDDPPMLRQYEGSREGLAPRYVIGQKGHFLSIDCSRPGSVSFRMHRRDPVKAPDRFLNTRMAEHRRHGHARHGSEILGRSHKKGEMIVTLA